MQFRSTHQNISFDAYCIIHTFDYRIVVLFACPFAIWMQICSLLQAEPPDIPSQLLSVLCLPFPPTPQSFSRPVFPDHYPWGMVSVFSSERPTLWWITSFPSPHKTYNLILQWAGSVWISSWPQPLCGDTDALGLWAEWPENQILGPAKLEEFEQLNRR